MKKNLLNISFLLSVIFSITLTSCKKKTDTPTPAATISTEIQSLIEYSGNISANTVIVNTQGGPVPQLFTSNLKEMLKSVNTQNTLVVNVHQVQTKTPQNFSSGEITFDQAIAYDKESIEMLYKVVKYFKNQGKKVYVLGISFGAFITQELIAEKGIDVADKYLIMVGRLDIDETIWKAFSEGRGGGYTNGVTPFLTNQTDIRAKNMSKLAAGLGHNRYTTKLAKYSDLSKVTYVYGKVDEQVGGKLADTEIQFLKDRKAQVLVSEKGHSGAVDEFIVSGFKQTFGL